MPKLSVQGHEYKLDSYATIGRSSKCTVQIKDIKLSRVHCEVIYYDGHWILVDLHSQNGTKLNNRGITESILKDGDKITVGRADILFQLAS
jgi:pSer/pThr/pTyr-binding forkhead associated (FHA) protein